MSERKKLKKLADKFDSKCESANAHDFVSAHRALALLICEEIGPKLSLKIFRKLDRESDGAGLAGLIGRACLGPKERFLKKRGVAEDWADWDLPAVE